jgi:superfamily II DNA/RNA helicase
VVRPESVEELVLDVIFQIRMDVRKAPGGKLSVLQDIYELLTIQQSIVFVEMRKDVDRIAQLMTQSG